MAHPPPPLKSFFKPRTESKWGGAVCISIGENDQSGGSDEALTFAEYDIKFNWKIYRLYKAAFLLAAGNKSLNREEA